MSLKLLRESVLLPFATANDQRLGSTHSVVA